MKYSNTECQIPNTQRMPVLLFIILSICCTQADIWHQVRRGNYELVEKGNYPGTLKYMPHPAQYEGYVNRCRREIERNLDLLPIMTKQYFTITQKLVYQYKFTWLDEDNQILLLRYFAHIYNDSVFAGYQILFVYDIRKNKIVKIFVSDVPLE
ncbi:MAG: hypothetical protein ACPL28_01625 [bacterium]